MHEGIVDVGKLGMLRALISFGFRYKSGDIKPVLELAVILLAS